MSKSLVDLDSGFRPKAERLLELAKQWGIILRVIDTLRTPEEQTENIANGVSWTLNSKHLPQPPEGKSKAIDVAPVVVLTMKNWAPAHPYWLMIGEMGEQIGMRWGGRWKKKDRCHFEEIGE